MKAEPKREMKSVQANLFLKDVVDQFRNLKRTADGAISQITDAQLFSQLDEESNSIAVIMKHAAGNLKSRWTDFLTSDGEKPNRKRDSEFVIGEGESKKSLLEKWEAGWRCVVEALESLTPDDLERTISIRGQPHSVVKAIHRSLTHSAYHVGQIVYLAKHLAGPGWRTLSVPRGKSEEFAAEMKKKFEGRQA
jgi:hypothetical protein